jgi:hypothetical protein
MKTSAALTSFLTLLSLQSAVGNAINVTLSGGQEVPPIASNVTGTATIELLKDGTIGYFVSLLNPSGVAVLGVDGAHLHCGASGTDGPLVAYLAQPVTGGLLTSPVEFSGFINATDIMDDSCGATIALLYASIRAGGAYINVHSTENPDGEVRGQIPEVTPEDDVIMVSLSGGQEVPPITSSVTGMIDIQLFSDGSIEYVANLTNPAQMTDDVWGGVKLLGADGAHIHCGAIGDNGPLVAYLAQPVVGGRNKSQVGFSGFIDVTSIMDDTCGATIDLIYESILAGRVYVNVHSTENPNGEVRGQIIFGATMPPMMDGATMAPMMDGATIAPMMDGYTMAPMVSPIFRRKL